MKRLIAIIVTISFIFSNFQTVWAQSAEGFNINQLPIPGAMVAPSQNFVPVLLKGLVIHPNQPFNFDFIVDSGNDSTDKANIQEQSQRMIRYFLTALTIPAGDLWVNLSPYEKDRIITNELGQTDMGRDMLAQDYVLKQLTASLIYPEKDLGKEFWSRIYKKVEAQTGNTNIPVNTFNKVWIVPNGADVFEHGNAIYVARARLKVMLEEDYLSLKKHNGISSICKSKEDKTHAIGNQVVREIILPEIEKEVNEGQNFALLRQVYYAAILAKWYRAEIQKTILAQVYVNKKKIAGIDLDDNTIKEQIYQRYLRAYKKGVFNYIKEDSENLTGQIVPRKYFSGGEIINPDEIYSKEVGPEEAHTVGLAFRQRVSVVPAGFSAAMMTPDNVDKRIIAKLMTGYSADSAAPELLIPQLQKNLSDEGENIKVENADLKEIFLLKRLFKNDSLLNRIKEANNRDILFMSSLRGPNEFVPTTIEDLNRNLQVIHINVGDREYYFIVGAAYPTLVRMEGDVLVTRMQPNELGNIFKPKNTALSFIKSLRRKNKYNELLLKVLSFVTNLRSNSHRGLGLTTQATADLVNAARQEAILFAGKDPKEYTTVFNNPRVAEINEEYLKSLGVDVAVIDSERFGLNIGIKALIIKKADEGKLKQPPANSPNQRVAIGGGQLNYNTHNYTRWAVLPDLLEPGTPNSDEIVIFGVALREIRTTEGANDDLFRNGKTNLSQQELLKLLRHDEFDGLLSEQIIRKLNKEAINGPLVANYDTGASNPTFEVIAKVRAKILQSNINDENRETIVNEAENNVREFLGASQNDYDVVFTGNATDGSNLAAENVLKNLHRLRSGGKKVRLAIVGDAHNSTRLPYQISEPVEYQPIVLGINKEGFYDIDAIRKLFEKHNKPGSTEDFIPVLVISAASNVLGTSNDIQELVNIAHLYGARVVIDDAQGFAHRRMNLRKLKADFVYVSSHKSYAPGSGVLVIRKTNDFNDGWQTYSSGEIQQFNKYGTQNLVGLAGFAKILKILNQIGMNNVQRHEQELTSYLYDRLEGTFGSNITLYGTREFDKRAGVGLFNFKDYPPDVVAKWLALKGIAVRPGFYCSLPVVFQALGGTIDELQALSDNTELDSSTPYRYPRAIRIGVGLTTTKEDVDNLVTALQELSNYNIKPNELERALAKRNIPAPPSGVLKEAKEKEIAGILQTTVEEVKRLNKGPRVSEYVDDAYQREVVGYSKSVVQELFSNNTKKAGDNAALVRNSKSINPWHQGGIDLNQISVNHTGQGVNLQFDAAQISEITRTEFNGFRIIVNSVTQIENPLSLMGVQVK